MIDQNKRSRPKPYIEIAIELFKKRNGEIIIEIGGMRNMLTHDLNKESCPMCNDGHSSVFWAQTGADFYSVEINPGCAQITAACCLNYPNAKIMNMDGIDFLTKLEPSFKIDLLYLDAWDVDSGNSAENHIRAFKIAEKHLHDESIILIDDTDVDYINGELVERQGEWGGKGRLLIPYAIGNGWKVLITGRQTLLSKNMP